MEHGQCSKENKIVQIAVIYVHPWLTNKSFNCTKSLISVITPVDKYVIIMIGITISLAGKPNINANKITPSNPITLANGSKKLEQVVSKDTPPRFVFARIHINNPAGAATTIALPNTKRVLSQIERTMTFPICGFLYGGSSKVNEDGTPFNTVFDKK